MQNKALVNIVIVVSSFLLQFIISKSHNAVTVSNTVAIATAAVYSEVLVFSSPDLMTSSSMATLV